MNQLKCGFAYDLELVRDGKVIDRDRVYNLVPIQGLNYMLETALRNGSPFANFYVALYSGAYNPVPGDTAATFPAAATELTAYSESTRRPLVLGAAAGGATDNSANRAEFTGTTNGQLAQGGFIVSTPTKGAATGVLVSAVRFNSPKPLDAGNILRVTAAFTIVSI